MKGSIANGFRWNKVLQQTNKQKGEAFTKYSFNIFHKFGIKYFD